MVKYMRVLLLLAIILPVSFYLQAQRDTLIIQKNKPVIRLRSFVVPAVMIGYGFSAIINEEFRDWNEEIKDDVYAEHPHAKIHLDNYLQFAPAAAVYGLNIAGIHGAHNFRDRTIIYAMSNVFLGVTVGAVKKWTAQLRPDSSAYTSFPSGHTAEAFASAEFLRQEYKDVSPWYGIAGYAAAAATGYLRLYNNKHWFSDVVAGAGVGIASTRLSYLIYPAIQKKFFKNKPVHAMLLPSYNNGAWGFSLVKQW